MEDVRLDLRWHLLTEALPVQAWTWRRASSGGQPLTEAGERNGYELRLSTFRQR
jgi:hypothetical protein